MTVKSILLIVLFPICSLSVQAQTGNYWTQKASVPGAVRESAVAFSIGNKGYAGTGNKDGGNYLWDFWEYDPALNIWNAKADFTPGMDSVGRRSAAGFGIGNKGYIGPGVGFDTIPPDQGDTMYNDFWEYDVNSDIWTEKTSCPTVGRHMYVAFEINGKGYIGTGITEGFFGNLRKDFWEYDPVTDSWSQKADFGGTARYLAVGFSLQGKGYIGTGLDSNNVRNDLWEYDPTINTWSQKTGLPSNKARCGATAFSIESVGKGYICLGGGSGGFWDLNEYDPSTDTWTQRANFPPGYRQGASGFSTYNRGYVFAGRDGATRFDDLWEYTPDSLTSISEVEPLIISVYPNPSQGRFILSITENEFDVEIYDSKGNMILFLRNESEIDLTTYPRGVYFLQVATENKSFGQKIVLQ